VTPSAQVVFDRVLVANRGEIACRVIRTLRRLGMSPVAVYSEADVRAMHVTLADEAWLIGGAPAVESYLRGDAIIDVALRSGAQAVHPGYGFLAENPNFAEACTDAGLIFIGPPAAAIRAMGDKTAAKALMERAGIPVVPGYHGDDQSLETLREAAIGIGVPLLIKASAGGGGKGMRVVEHLDEFEAALTSARREAAAAFGDDRVLLERYLERPRHVEIQVFADSFGETVHLFERDCSIQRRHQKIVEEAPAPGLTPELRERMGSAAVEAARAVGYVGAGTVEFLLASDGSYYFMEMNTRLQVEHPVTEFVTGSDLVEWQLRVAAGEPLPRRQGELALRGHAVEVRVYAEQPTRGFLPSTGTITHLRTPEEGPHVRVDTGVRQGDAVTVHYDPLIAKLVVWDEDRPTALRRLRSALADFEVVGPATNLSMLAAVAAHPAYARGDLDTGFVDRFVDDLLADASPAEDTLALASLGVLLERRASAEMTALASEDPWSPWWRNEGWRPNSPPQVALDLGAKGAPSTIRARPVLGGYRLDLPTGAMTVLGELDTSGGLTAAIDGRRRRVTVLRRGCALTLIDAGHVTELALEDHEAATVDDEVPGGRLTAPMPGRVLAVMVEPGATVRRGQPLLTLEAMKMEHTITAPADGTVLEVCFRVDDAVIEGQELILIESRASGAGGARVPASGASAASAPSTSGNPAAPLDPDADHP